jgi:actin
MPTPTSSTLHALASWSCPTADLEYIRDLKDKYSYVALDYNMEMSKTSAPSFQKKFTLPDGKEINLGQEAFMCSEVLFDTSLLGESSQGAVVQ